MLFVPRLRKHAAGSLLKLRSISKAFSASLGPGLQHFISNSLKSKLEVNDGQFDSTLAPYITKPDLPRRIYIETYGCQMNFNDTEIVLGILGKHGGFVRADAPENADVVLLMTCAIRENAETKIWNRLDVLRSLERKLGRNLVIGVLGCMAERLKEDIMEKKRYVDVVCGPDAYRSLPGLLQAADSGQQGINVVLSFDETYADVAPVRIDHNSKSAFISIMRGCDNMCSYCIVPFTRGRERSRPIDSIVNEAISLRDQGVKEITLLGQNVNSYRDQSSQSFGAEPTNLSSGFKSIYRPKVGGLRFSDLLEKVADAVPEVRIRFTSPHPKDFPDELLYLMRDKGNICNQIHLPAQSGSNHVLEKMRRGYTSEAYLELVDHIRSIIPQVSLSSDFIVGFCGETDSDHGQTLDLVRQVDYDMIYMFAYSMREKTMAHRRYNDDVLEAVKQQRLRELIDLFYSGLAKKVQRTIGSTEQILVEGPSKKNSEMLAGRTDGNKTVVFSPPKNRSISPGDVITVRITDVSGSTPIGEHLEHDIETNLRY